MIGGTTGCMSGMNSPDDFLFWLHHSNMDRFWAIWTDCHDYENVNSNNITQSIFPAQWSEKFLDPFHNFHKIDDHMPYFYPNQNVSATRLTASGSTPTPREMLFLGSPEEVGHDGIYYRYGPDRIAETYDCDPQFEGLCNIDSLVNIYNNDSKKKRR